MKTISLTALALSSALLFAAPALADFSDTYAPGNWMTTFTGPLTGTPGQGSVDTSLAPNSIKLNGADNGEGYPGIGESNVDFTIEILHNGTVMFDWDWETDDAPFWDPFGYLLNNVFYQLTDTSSTSQSNWESVVVAAGDIFGFRQHSVDTIFGPGMTTISKFYLGTQTTPEPSTMILLGTGLAGLVAWKRRKTA